MSGDWSSWVIFAIIIILAFWLFSRGRRRSSSPRLQVAINMISIVNDNLKILERHITDKEYTKKFKTVEWNIYKEKLEFLGEATVNALNESNTIMTEFNEAIESARKNRNTTLLQGINFEKLREPLSRGKAGLAQWLRVNIQKELPGRGGLFGW